LNLHRLGKAEAPAPQVVEADYGVLSRRLKLRKNHSNWTPPVLITFSHFSVSARTTAPKSAGEPLIVIPPISARRAFILSSAKPALISLLSLSMIPPGVPFGTLMPKKALAS